ncbi:P-loop containing nucleoside triphosphate hydrolase protein [Mycena pura]|uniref:DNA 3'-5' helicase n=1 Tax=Mycena pura TaxID=153505 RepID=A0AAD6VBT9_9AGAR|nr:P-loop containing nucleoside triphosphate hydrolase protein [Mycena pura]
MDTPEDSWELDLQESLAEIRQLPLLELESLAAEFLPTETLPTAYLNSLDDKRRSIALRACLLVHLTSRCRFVPRQYQLEANDALENGRDGIIDSGTGSGKTMCQIIPNLLHPTTTSMTISPLKRLQILQAAEFERWGVRTICINEDTPNDKELWNNISNGHYQHLIVQPEQLKSHKGHLPRLARLLNVPQFAKSIRRVHVDEAHHIHTAGLPLYGLPAFRPSWGALNELRIRLPKGTPIQALSATYPPHIKSAVVENLNFNRKNHLSMKLSSNRPNIIYATHRIVGSLSDFRHLDFLISTPFTKLMKVVVFHDDTEQCADAAAYHDTLLPPELRNKGLVRHYHGGMSKDYLKQVFDDFSQESGGLDVGGIDVVIDYGVPRTQSTAIQRGGRAGRRGQISVYLVMAEPWAFTASIDAADPDSADPDRPISGQLVKNSRKPERTGLAMVLYVRTVLCLRKTIAQYLADGTRDALQVSTAWCCDRPHPENPSLCFDKRDFFPGRFIYQESNGAIYAGDTDEQDRLHLNPPKTKKRKAKGPPNRKIVDRADLQARLRDWLWSAHANDALRGVRPASFILDGKGIKVLSAVHPDRMHSVSQVVSALDETQEWGQEWGDKVLEVISAYDAELAKLVPQPAVPVRTGQVTRTATTRGPKQQSKEDEYIPPAKKTRIEAPLADISLNVRRSSRLSKSSK